MLENDCEHLLNEFFLIELIRNEDPIMQNVIQKWYNDRLDLWVLIIFYITLQLVFLVLVPFLTVELYESSYNLLIYSMFMDMHFILRILKFWRSLLHVRIFFIILTRSFDSFMRSFSKGFYNILSILAINRRHSFNCTFDF